VVAWSPARVSSYGPVPCHSSPALSPSVGLEQSLGWRGKRVDETGLVYMGARHYDPTAGRFTTADPLGHAGSVDLFSFAVGDPVNFFDPSGRFGKMINDQYQGLVDNYNNAQQIAQSESTYGNSDFQYSDENDASLAQWSALVDMILVVGGLKQWYEMDTGKDAFTGAWLQGNDYLTALSIVGNFLPVAFGPAALLEGGGEGAFIGAGERGLIGVGAEEEAFTAGNVGTMDAADGENAAFKATENAVDPSPAQTFGATQQESLAADNNSAANATSVYNARTSASITQSVLDNIDPTKFKANTRFGPAFYVSEEGETAVAEVGNRGATASQVIRYNLDLSGANVLDLCDATTASRWGYTGGNDYSASQAIANRARAVGFNVIKYPSLRGLGNNYAIFNDFDELLDPQMVSPVHVP
jgi:RHS repeat-associated protein